MTPQHTELWLWVDEGARDCASRCPTFTATAMDCGGEAVAGGGVLGGTPLVESAASLLQAAEGGGNFVRGRRQWSYESHSEYGRHYSDPDKADGSYEYQLRVWRGRGAVRRRRGGRRPSQPGGRPSIGPQPLDLGIAGAVMAVAAAGAMLWTRLRAPRTSIGDGSVVAAREARRLSQRTRLGRRNIPTGRARAPQNRRSRRCRCHATGRAGAVGVDGEEAAELRQAAVVARLQLLPVGDRDADHVLQAERRELERRRPYEPTTGRFSNSSPGTAGQRPAPLPWSSELWIQPASPNGLPM